MKAIAFDESDDRFLDIYVREEQVQPLREHIRKVFGISRSDCLLELLRIELDNQRIESGDVDKIKACAESFINNSNGSVWIVLNSRWLQLGCLY